MLRVYGCVFCSISLLSVYMCVRIHLSSRSIAGVLSSRALPVFPSHHLCAFLIDGCVATKQQKNGNLGDSEQKSNLNKLKVCDTDFRKKIWFPPIIPILSLVLFLKSSAISFGRKLHPVHRTEKMETSVTEKKSNLIKLKVCDKDLRKQIWFPPRVPILHGPFSEIQCDKFLSQITPHSLVTVPWPWSPSGLRCIVMSTNPNKRSRVQIHLLRKNKITSGQRNKSDSSKKCSDKPVRKPKEIETCDNSGVFWRRCVKWRPRF